MKTKILTMTEWETARENAQQHEQKFLNILLSEIGLVKNTFTDNIVNIKGRPMSVSQQFINDFMGACGLGGVAKSFKNIDNGEISAQILNSVRSAMRTNDKTYRIIVAPNNEIVRLVETSTARLSNKAIFDLSEHIANKYGLDVIGADTDNYGNSTLRLVSNTQVSVTNENDEVHKFGISIRSEYGVTKIDNFALRLVCTNGLETTDNFSHFDLRGISPRELTDLFNHILSMKNNGFVPKDFVELVNKAKRTQASICETESTINSIIKRLGGFGEVENEQTEMLRNRFLSEFFPEYMHRKIELLGKGFDLTKMSREQKQYIHCGSVNIWDLVNILTNFGSNNLGMKINEPKWLQIEGGKLLNAKHDLNSDIIGLLRL